MPRGDGTGPTGAGSMTGRAMGLCAGNSVPGYTNGGFGRGMGSGRGLGFGRGFGRGYGRGFGRSFGFFGNSAYTPVSVNEKEMLKNETTALESQLKAVKQRLDELEKVDSK